MKVKAKVELLKHQEKFLFSKAPFPALVGGFGCGKTYSQMHRALKLMYKYGEALRGFYSYAIYLPSYDMVRNIYFPEFTKLLNTYRIPHTLNKQEKVLYIHGYGTILFRSMDDPTKIVGYETHDCGIDELDTMQHDKAKDNFNMIIARNRKLKPNGDINTCAISTTPEGFRFVYYKWIKETEMLEDEEEKEKRKQEFEIIKGITYDNPYLSPNYIKNLESQYSPEMLKAYLYGEFINLKGNTVYSGYDRIKNGTNRRLQKGDTLHIGMDFNVGNMSAVVHVVENKKVYAIDEIDCHIDDKYKKIEDTPDMIKEIKRRYKGHKVFVYPDSSGNSKKSINASETDISLLKKYFKVRIPKDRVVKNRVSTMNAMFLNIKGERRYFVNDMLCKNFCDCLEKQIWDEKGEPDKSQGYDHMNDAAGYFIYAAFRINRRTFRIISSPV